MLIKNIKISNFKSFDHLSIDLGKFNVLIGANASGKSNFVSALQFLKDIVDNGLDNAISMQGGVEYLRNMNIATSQNLSIELSIDLPERPYRFSLALQRQQGPVSITARGFSYKLAINFPKPKRTYRVVEEKLVLICDFYQLDRTHKSKETEKLGQGTVTITRRDNQLDFFVESDGPIQAKDFGPPFGPPFLEKPSHKESILEQPPLFPVFLVNNFLSEISTYDFDPKRSKKATVITGKTELESDGSNLAIVLNDILADRRKTARLSNLIRSLLPFVRELGIEKLADKSLLAGLREVYFGKRFLPATLLSDGTISMTALIVALYFERRPFIVLEEPERNIHPYLISKIVEMMKDVSERLEKQILVTTQHPEIVRHAGIENLLLVHRDEKGFSEITKPWELQQVRTFLEQKMGVEELYVQNLLQW